MSGSYSFFDLETGLLGGSMSFDYEPPSSYGGKLVVKGNYDPELHYFNGSMVTFRPHTGMPDSHTLPANTEWHLSGVPEGTVVFIDGVEQGVVENQGLTLEFPEARTWRVFLKAPLPYISKECLVEVA